MLLVHYSVKTEKKLLMCCLQTMPVSLTFSWVASLSCLQLNKAGIFSNNMRGSAGIGLQRCVHVLWQLSSKFCLDIEAPVSVCGSGNWGWGAFWGLGARGISDHRLEVIYSQSSLLQSGRVGCKASGLWRLLPPPRYVHMPLVPCSAPTAAALLGHPFQGQVP